MNANIFQSEFNHLPKDAAQAILVGRVWRSSEQGPSLVLVRDSELVCIDHIASTMSALLELPDLPRILRQESGTSLGSIESWIERTQLSQGNPADDHLLAPNDLQVVKAAGVTFAASMVERVIEEQARGDATKAESVRKKVTASVGSDLSTIKPGSDQAMSLKAILIEQGMWSQYLEVGIGPDAEVFTKAAPMSTVGTAVKVGLHPKSQWNNPEPEIVLTVNSKANIVGAALGNDVNLRDFEGRSALLLGKAKDNNGSCAIGPFIRVFDEHFSLEDVRNAHISLRVEGDDGFVLHDKSSMSFISRDPIELVTHAMGPYHQYPDGMMLFCGSMFAPIQDRDKQGGGFTHHLNDRVTISNDKLGSLVNWVGHSDCIPPWNFGITALFEFLQRRDRSNNEEI